ncbi:MAG: phosphatidylserine decarboxylase [Polyangiaceae bacterium]|nr:phosphatidylserine decarboxylase [Polyangiaceae bacterium]
MNVGTYAVAQLLRALPRGRISRAVGRLAELDLPPVVARAVVGLYAEAYRVDLGEAEAPAGAYPSFDAFFTRPLRPGARPCHAPPGAVVSPADGRLDALGRIDRAGLVPVKGREYRVAELCGDEVAAERYHGGELAVIYLSPRDYHRVHAPVGGRVRVVRSLPGDFYPVNAIGERHVPRLLARNRRVAAVIELEGGGELTLVMVAAMIVGRITLAPFAERDVPLGEHPLEPPFALERGAELGVFHLGSTVVLLQTPGAPPFVRALGAIRVGDPLTESVARQADGG